MKRYLLLLCLTLAVAIQASPDNAEKSQVPLADPYILLDGDTYYAYGTHADNGIECYTSTDLKSWHYAGLALQRDNTTETRWFWAPEVYKFDSKYYMYYSANEHLYVATADTPAGPFKQVGTYMMDKVLSSEKCIDSSVFTDDDGTQWIFFVRFTDGNCIWQCKLNDDHITPDASTLKHVISVSQDWEKVMGRVCEGPFVVKHMKRYYLTYSANDYQSPKYGVGYAYATKIDGTWGKSSKNPVLQGIEGLVGTGHHSFFYDKEGNFRIVFHAHNSTSQIHPRMMYIGSMKWDGYVLEYDDATPVISPKLATTGIQNVSTTPAHTEVSYNLSGQRVGKSAKGILIVKDARGKVSKRMVR